MKELLFAFVEWKILKVKISKYFVVIQQSHEEYDISIKKNPLNSCFKYKVTLQVQGELKRGCWNSTKAGK